MMAGLKRQTLILEELIQKIENKSELKSEDRVDYDKKTRLVAANLRKLRKIKDHYPSFTVIASEALPAIRQAGKQSDL